MLDLDRRTDDRGDFIKVFQRSRYAGLDLETDVAWAGFANDRLRARVEPALRAALERHALLPR